MKEERLKRGDFKKMTPEQQTEWKHYLQKRWRDNHKDKMHAENKKWFEHYKTVKPYICVCKRCGAEFNSPRPYYKLCGKCPTLTELRKNQIRERWEQRRQNILEALELRNQGLTQEKIAKRFNTSQENISRWFREAKKLLTDK